MKPLTRTDLAALAAIIVVAWITAGMSYQAICYTDDYKCDDMSIALHDRLTAAGIDSYYAGYIGNTETPGHVWIVVRIGSVEIPFETTNGMGIPTHPFRKYASPDVVFTTTEEMRAYRGWRT